MADEQQTYPWQEGVPTKPDVDALMKAFPAETIVSGQWRTTDEEVRAHIGRSDGARYRTVYSAWIHRLRADHRIIVYRHKMVGFYCPTPEQVFARTHPVLSTAGHYISEHLRNLTNVKAETEQQRSVQEHQGRLLHATKRGLKKDRMNVLPPTAAPTAPQIAAPRKATT